MDQEVLDWLLASDPSVVFQTKRDLLYKAKLTWESDREEMKTRGWAKQLLDLQDDDGKWGEGLYSPKFISTHYTLLLLRRLGMVTTPEIHRACRRLVRLEHIGMVSTTDPKKIDTCITGMGLSIIAHFEEFSHLYDEIFEFLEKEQMEDGGWNCRRRKEEVSHSSMHTTLAVLEGLRELAEHDKAFTAKVELLREPAHEFLLKHELFKSHTTGEIIDEGFIDITFPPRWKYNILTALDYFGMINHPYDPRMDAALEIIESRKRSDRWPQGTQMAGKTFFSMNIPYEGSPFNTLRAMRVLRYYKTRKEEYEKAIEDAKKAKEAEAKAAEEEAKALEEAEKKAKEEDKIAETKAAEETEQELEEDEDLEEDLEEELDEDEELEELEEVDRELGEDEELEEIEGLEDD